MAGCGGCLADSSTGDDSCHRGSHQVHVGSSSCAVTNATGRAVVCWLGVPGGGGGSQAEGGRSVDQF